MRLGGSWSVPLGLRSPGAMLWLAACTADDVKQMLKDAQHKVQKLMKDATQPKAKDGKK